MRNVRLKNSRQHFRWALPISFISKRGDGFDVFVIFRTIIMSRIIPRFDFFDLLLQLGLYLWAFCARNLFLQLHDLGSAKGVVKENRVHEVYPGFAKRVRAVVDPLAPDAAGKSLEEFIHSVFDLPHGMQHHEIKAVAPFMCEAVGAAGNVYRVCHPVIGSQRAVRILFHYQFQP